MVTNSAMVLLVLESPKQQNIQKSWEGRPVTYEQVNLFLE